MTNKNLIKILKNQTLREASSPRETWVRETRALLIARAKHEQSTLPVLRRTFLNLFFSIFDIKAFKRATVALVMVAFVFSSFVGFVSAANSLPGDALYGVKIAAEKARVELAPKKQKPVLRAELAGRRLKEIMKVTAKPVKGKDKKVQAAATIFKQEMKNVNRDLDRLRTTKKPDEVLKTASQVDQKIGEYIDILKKQEPTLSKPIRSELKRVKQAVLETSVKTAAVLVAEAVDSSVGKEDAAKAVAKNLLAIEDQMADLIPTLQATSTPLSVLAPAKNVIADAKIKLSSQDLESAVALLAEGSKLISSAENTFGVDAGSTQVATSGDTGSASAAVTNNVPPSSRTNDSEQGLETKNIKNSEADTVKIDLFFDSGS